jgi:hypothetical protein
MKKIKNTVGVLQADHPCSDYLQYFCLDAITTAISLLPLVGKIMSLLHQT